MAGRAAKMAMKTMWPAALRPSRQAHERTRRVDNAGQMSQPLSELDIQALQPGDIALLLDFDGTLVEIAGQPDNVVVSPGTVRVLADLDAALSGAVAIVSGRSIASIDALLEPWKLAVSGTHGMERRDHFGNRHDSQYDAGDLDAVQRELAAATAGAHGLLLERKPGSVALHYRQRPDLAAACLEHAAKVADRHENASLLAGKMVVEVKLGARTKADAVFDFMAEAPFNGRTPIYAGDDLTDEDAFRAVADLHGTSITVGRDTNAADYRAADTASFLDWLTALAAHLDQQSTGSTGKEQPIE